MALYMVYDLDGVHEPPSYGIYSTEVKAREAIEKLVNEIVDEIMADDPRVTGLEAGDRDWLVRDTRRAFAMQVLEGGIDTAIKDSKIIYPYI